MIACPEQLERERIEAKREAHRQARYLRLLRLWFASREWISADCQNGRVTGATTLSVDTLRALKNLVAALVAVKGEETDDTP